MERNLTLEKAIFDYIKDNDSIDSINITSHFKININKTLSSLKQLVNDNKVNRRELSGYLNHEYYIV